MSKHTGTHSREERLKKLAEAEAEGRTIPIASSGEEDVPADDASSAAAAEATVALADALPEADGSGSEPVPDATAVISPIAAADDALAGFDIDAAGYPLNSEIISGNNFIAKDFGEIPTKRKRRALRAFGITCGVVVALLLSAYIVGAVTFMGKMLPNTTVQGIDLSLKSDDEAAAALDALASSYTLAVSGEDFSFTTTGPEIGMAVESRKIVEGIHADLDPWRWPVLLAQSAHDETALMSSTFDADVCNAAVTEAVKAFNKKAKAPVDATVVYDQKTQAFTVKPEEEGTQLNAEAVVAAVVEAVAGFQGSVELSDDHRMKPKLYATDEKLIESAELATGMISAHVSLNLNGNVVDEIDGSEISQFVNIDDKLNVKLDEDGLNEWVRNLANGFDTIGTERTYTRADGQTITVKGGSYGWEVDTAATKEAVLDAVKAGDTVEVGVPCISTAAVFSGPGERDWGSRYLDVDVSEQHVRFYGDDGKVLWETDFISGTPDGKHDTVQGVWYVNNKESPSKLIGYKEDGKTKDYEVEVKYWMPFEGNSIGFHDANWQPSFGGSMYKDGYGSHGCINLSVADAKKLYSIIQIGDVVVVHE